MKIQKRVLAPLEKCYAVHALELGGRLKYLFASEVNAPCFCIDAETLACDTVWTQGGGTMGMAPFGDAGDTFLAIQNFFPPFVAADAKIVRVRATADGYETQDFLHMPYLHRFGIIAREGRQWLVLATLCRSKQNKDDWTQPGSVYSLDLNDPEAKPRLVLDGQFHNHGFYTGSFAGQPCAAIGSDQGAWLLFPPEGEGEDWRIRQMTDVPTGEVWLEDLDGDGLEELATIEAFHGTALRVYHQTEEGRWRCVWTCAQSMTFAHALWCGELFGRRCGVCGSRRDTAPLFAFWMEDGQYRTELIEEGASASNVWVSRYRGQSCLLAANHGRNECAMYTME